MSLNKDVAFSLPSCFSIADNSIVKFYIYHRHVGVLFTEYYNKLK